MRAAHQRPATRREFGGLEWLAQEIIGAQVERFYLVGQRTTGGENERGERFSGAAQPAHQSKAVGAGQSNIDYGQREFLVGDRRLRGFGAADAVHRVARGRQTAQDGIGNQVIVFY